MGKSKDQIHIYRPHSLRELTGLIKEFPGVPFIAGGTDFMQKLNRGSLNPLPPYLICLASVEELGKIKRRENFIDIGACVPLERIISMGKNLIPGILIGALSHIAGPSVRNLATIGGNITLASPFSDSLLPLLLLEARCELRRMTTHSWVPLARLVKSPWKTGLNPAEVLTTISIPVTRWDIEQFEKLNIITQPALSLLKFAAVARIYRSTVTDFRMIFGGIDPLFVRNRELEAMLIGAKVPFTHKIADQFAERINNFIESLDAPFLPEKYHRHSAFRLAKAFFDKVSSYRELR